MRWEKEGPLGAQLPVSASVVRGYDIVVGGDVGIDRLVTDLEDAPDAADRHSPAIIFTSLLVGGDEGARGQVPAFEEVIIEEGLQRHGIDVRPILIASKRSRSQLLHAAPCQTGRRQSRVRLTTFRCQAHRLSRLETERLAQGPKPNLPLDPIVWASSAKRRTPE